MANTISPTKLTQHLADPRKKIATRERIIDVVRGGDERSVGETIAYAAYCTFMQQLNMPPNSYSSWRIGNRVVNASTDLRRSPKSRWLQIRDKKITVGSIVTRSPDPKLLLKVINISPDCMVIVSPPNQVHTFSVSPDCLVKVAQPAKHRLFNTIA